MYVTNNIAYAITVLWSKTSSEENQNSKVMTEIFKWSITNFKVGIRDRRKKNILTIFFYLFILNGAVHDKRLHFTTTQQPVT